MWKGGFNFVWELGIDLKANIVYDDLPSCNVPPLQPEGSVLKDRFKSLQKRNLIEPRERAKWEPLVVLFNEQIDALLNIVFYNLLFSYRFTRRYKLKYVEKRAFKEIS